MRFPVFVCVLIACVSGATARRARRGVGAVLSARDEAADARAVLGEPPASLDVLVKEADKRLAAPPLINAGAHDFMVALGSGEGHEASFTWPLPAPEPAPASAHAAAPPASARAYILFKCRGETASVAQVPALTSSAVQKASWKEVPTELHSGLWNMDRHYIPEVTNIAAIELSAPTSEKEIAQVAALRAGVRALAHTCSKAAYLVALKKARDGMMADNKNGKVDQFLVAVRLDDNGVGEKLKSTAADAEATAEKLKKVRSDVEKEIATLEARLRVLTSLMHRVVVGAAKDDASAAVNKAAAELASAKSTVGTLPWYQVVAAYTDGIKFNALSGKLVIRVKLQKDGKIDFSHLLPDDQAIVVDSKSNKEATKDVMDFVRQYANSIKTDSKHIYKSVKEIDEYKAETLATWNEKKVAAEAAVTALSTALSPRPIFSGVAVLLSDDTSFFFSKGPVTYLNAWAANKWTVERLALYCGKTADNVVKETLGWAAISDNGAGDVDSRTTFTLPEPLMLKQCHRINSAEAADQDATIWKELIASGSCGKNGLKNNCFCLQLGDNTAGPVRPHMFDRARKTRSLRDATDKQLAWLRLSMPEPAQMSFGAAVSAVDALCRASPEKEFGPKDAHDYIRNQLQEAKRHLAVWVNAAYAEAVLSRWAFNDLTPLLQAAEAWFQGTFPAIREKANAAVDAAASAVQHGQAETTLALKQSNNIIMPEKQKEIKPINNILAQRVSMVVPDWHNPYSVGAYAKDSSGRFFFQLTLSDAQQQGKQSCVWITRSTFRKAVQEYCTAKSIKNEDLLDVSSTDTMFITKSRENMREWLIKAGNRGALREISHGFGSFNGFLDGPLPVVASPRAEFVFGKDGRSCKPFGTTRDLMAAIGEMSTVADGVCHEKRMAKTNLLPISSDHNRVPMNVHVTHFVKVGSTVYYRVKVVGTGTSLTDTRYAWSKPNFGNPTNGRGLRSVSCHVVWKRYTNFDEFQKTVNEVCTDVQTGAKQTAFRLTKNIDDAKDSLQKICMDENPTTKDNGLEKRRQCFFEKVLQRLTDLAEGDLEGDLPRLRQALADFLQPTTPNTVANTVAAAVGASTNCDDSDAIYHNLYLKPKSPPWLTREVPNSNVQLWSQREFHDD